MNYELRTMNSFRDDFKALLKALGWYSHKKIRFLAKEFEEFKNWLVEVLMQRRGELQKRFWHGSMVTLTLVGILTSGIFGDTSLISSTYPGIGGPDPRFVTAFEPFPGGVLISSAQDTRTSVSQKPRDKVEEYTVKEGDTLSSIAEKYDISQDSVKWENDLTNTNQIKPDQILKILPVTGISVKVKSGDTLESVAKKYSANQQAILDFPFNDIPDDFALKIGQLLIVPDGSPPEVPAVKKYRPQPQYLANGSQSPAFTAPGGGQFIWPTSGAMTQYFSWYHTGIDVASSSAPGIAASDGGVIIVAGWPDNSGYGNRVVIDHGNGYQSLYAHMSNIYVSPGETVSRGQLVGQMGSTGRSTGTHLHLEIHFKGVALNPLNILK